jgi:outer membrane cobalamin receptor
LKKVFLTLGMVLFLVPSLAFGQEEIEPVVVTGSRIYTSLLEFPAPTYVIDRDEIERSGGIRN